MGLEQTIIGALRARIVALGLDPDNGRWGSLTEVERDGIVGAIAQGLLGHDRETTVHAIVKAFSDNRLSTSDLRAVLVAWAKTQTSDTVVQKILGVLETGQPITTQQFIEVASAWVVRQSAHEPRIAELLAVVAGGTFDADAAWALVIRFLEAAGMPKPVLDRLANTVGHQVATRDAVLAVVFYAAATGPDRLKQVLDAGNPQPAQAVVAFLAGGVATHDGKPAADVQRLFELVAEQRWLDAVAVLLGGLHLGAAQRLIERLAAGQLKEFLTGELARVIRSRLGVDAATADSIIAAAIRLAIGTQKFLAIAPESDAPDLTPKEIALWREIREVVYLAQLAAFGGSIVPTDPGAPPHVFLAASIRYSNRISTVAKPKAKDKDIQALCNAVTAFLDTHFGPRMTRTFQQDGVLAVSLEEFKRPIDQQPRCRVLQSKLTLRLKEGV